MDKSVEHTEKPQERKEATLQSDVAPKTAAPAYLHKDTEGKTKGEKIFDTSVYTGLNYLINLAASVAITEYFMVGKGKPKMEHWVENTSKFLTEKGMSETTAHKASKVGIEYLGLTSGGTALMLPVMWLENRKKKLVFWLNKTFARDTVDPNDPNAQKSLVGILNTKEEELPSTSFDQPQQGLLNAAWRRGLGMLLVVGWGQAIEHTYGNEKLKNNISDITQGAGSIAKNVTGLDAPHKFTQSPTVVRRTQWTIMDALNTGITAGVTYFTNGAKKHKNGKNNENTANTEQGIVQSALSPNIQPASTQEPMNAVPTPRLEEVSSISGYEQKIKSTLNEKGWKPSPSFVENLNQQQDSPPTLAV